MEDNVFSFIHHGHLTVRGPKEAMQQIVVVLDDHEDDPIEIKMSEESMPASVQAHMRERLEKRHKMTERIVAEIEAERATAEAAPTTSATP